MVLRLILGGMIDDGKVVEFAYKLIGNYLDATLCWFCCQYWHHVEADCSLDKNHIVLVKCFSPLMLLWLAPWGSSYSRWGLHIFRQSYIVNWCMDESWQVLSWSLFMCNWKGYCFILDQKLHSMRSFLVYPTARSLSFSHSFCCSSLLK